MAVCAAVKTALRRQIQNLEKLRQRRLHSTKINGAKPTESAQQQGPITPPAKILPPPLWTRLGPLTRAAQAYGRAHHKRPKTTQLLTSLFIFLCGDISAQTISGEDHDFGRTARALFIGGSSSLPSYFWVVYLSNNFNFASRALSITARVVVNQIVFAPLFNIYFFGTQALLSGASTAEIWERLVKTVPRSVLNSAKLWPAVMTINFAFVPLPFRSMFTLRSNMATPFLRTRHSLSSAFRPLARNSAPRINHAIPRRPASTASSSSSSSSSSGGGSSAKTIAISAALGSSAILLYYYGTDTRASFHKYLVPRAIRVLFPDAEDAHHAGTAALKALYSVGLHPRERVQDVDTTGAKPLSVNVFGVELSNPIGISAGLDKDAEIPDPLFALGAGVVEVGGITPLPQEGNPKPRVFRVVSTDGLINRYGLNSKGADAVAAHLRERLRTFARSIGLTEKEMLDGEAAVPVGSLKDGRLLCVQIAKNKKTDEKDVEAVKKDYVTCVNRLAPYADVLVVNVSSPNTPGLRDLQATGPLTALLSAVVEEAQKTKRKVKPRVMVKVSPDEDDDSQMEGVVQAVWMSGVDGVIVGNTTKKRTGLVPEGVRLTSQEQKNIMEDGGYSGPALFSQTLDLIGRYRKMLDSYSLTTEGLDNAFGKNQKVIFATGGITNGEQALKVLNAGASVAMVYTGMVYGGSGTITRLKNEMREKLAIEDKKQ
ncbi:hypothetical protein QBC40DRAFT_308881 [Triangularia verruculosa]|uniref:Dihydroorotate dehydrogenase (quinone), mitochondrial n=1 Tax=Triangularia verruculosa TaxID=2587418 RepID=A0AAN6XBE6_9PEZI|nr:hypothetical protein QBC40DRAFT_308881 [Triangularia verruculosa]